MRRLYMTRPWTRRTTALDSFPMGRLPSSFDNSPPGGVQFCAAGIDYSPKQSEIGDQHFHVVNWNDTVLVAVDNMKIQAIKN